MSEPFRGGPANPTPAAIATLRPLSFDAARFDPDGLFGGWQRRNAEATLPHCVEKLHERGHLDNLRRVLGERSGEFKGLWFADSDIYKTLEAVAWQLGRDRSDERLTAFLELATGLL